MKKNECPIIDVGEILMNRWKKEDKITVRTLAEILSYGVINDWWDADSEVSLLIETDDGDTIVGNLDEINFNETIAYNDCTRVKGLDLISKNSKED